jgi:hypothetical protein
VKYKTELLKNNILIFNNMHGKEKRKTPVQDLIERIMSTPSLSHEDKKTLQMIVERIECKVAVYSALLKKLPPYAYNAIVSLLKQLDERNREKIAKSIIQILRENKVEPAERITWSLINQACTIPSFVAGELFALRYSPKTLSRPKKIKR